MIKLPKIDLGGIKQKVENAGHKAEAFAKKHPAPFVVATAAGPMVALDGFVAIAKLHGVDIEPALVVAGNAGTALLGGGGAYLLNKQLRQSVPDGMA